MSGPHRFLIVVALTGMVVQPAIQDAQAAAPDFSHLREWKWSAPINAGSSINSEVEESSLFLANDSCTLLFSSNRGGGEGNYDLWFVQRDNPEAEWGEVQNFGPAVNSNAYEAGGAITDDGRVLVFCSNRPGKRGEMDLYVSVRESRDAPWGKAVNLGANVNSNEGDWGPSLTPDGQTLTFASTRPGGVGNVDLWQSTRNSCLEPWGPPMNLGVWINSPEFDWDARYADAGLALIFTSNRTGALGGDDLWLNTRPSRDQPFGMPLHLEAPVNSEHNDSAGFLSPDGLTLWFGSNRPGGAGQTDIWYAKRIVE